MVGVRRVPQPEDERDRERHEQRRPLEQAAEPCVDVLERRAGGVQAHGEAAATAAWPKETPPSFGGRRSGTSTRRPRASSPPAVAVSSVRFWNTPPESTTVPSAARPATSAAASAVATATPAWKRAETIPASVPRATSA